MGFRVNLIPGVANYKDIYTHYRFDSIHLKFYPLGTEVLVDDADNGTSASGIQKATPIFYYRRLYGDEVPSQFVYSGETSCLVDGARAIKMNRGFSMKWVPNSLGVVQTSRPVNSASLPPNQGAQIQKKKWHSLNDWGIPFYGFKYGISSTYSDDAEFLYRVIATAKISFKGKNDSNTTSGGGVGTVVIPFTDMTT